MKGKIADFTVSIREGGPSAESHPGELLLVRPGVSAGKYADGWSTVTGRMKRVQWFAPLCEGSGGTAEDNCLSSRNNREERFFRFLEDAV